MDPMDETATTHGSSDLPGGDVEEHRYFTKVIDSFLHYKSSSMRRIALKHKDFLAMPEAHRSMLPLFEERLERATKAIEANDAFFRLMMSSVSGMFENNSPIADQSTDHPQPPLLVTSEDMNRVRTTLTQLVRDWSAEGKAEREETYGPMLEALERLYPKDKIDRSQLRVLVPGAGLARLLLEVAVRGFSCQGNEFSFFMLVASHLMLNVAKTVDQYTVYPWVHQTCNNVSPDDHLRCVRIPDIKPDQVPVGVQFSMAAGDFLEVYSEPQAWSCVMTSFFIDTAHNIIAYVERISSILEPGGYWINFGPLLFHFADLPSEPSVEMSYEELRRIIVQTFGFELVEERTGVRTSYIRNPRSMLWYCYECIFFVARKRALPSTPP